MANLAACYLLGIGTPKDVQKAKELYARIPAQDIAQWKKLYAQNPAPEELIYRLLKYFG